MSHSVISSFVEYFQEVLRLNSGMNADKEESQTQDLRSGEPNLNSNEGIYHAVHIPRDNGQGDSSKFFPLSLSNFSNYWFTYGFYNFIKGVVNCP